MGKYSRSKEQGTIFSDELQAAFLTIKTLLSKIDKPHIQFEIYRQQNCNNIHKQIRWNPLTSTLILCNRIMALCSEKESDTVSGLCTKNEQLHSRQEVKSVQGLTRVDVKSPGVSTVFAQITWERSKSVASRINDQLRVFVNWRPEPGAMACDAFNLNWGLLKGYLFHHFA